MHSKQPFDFRDLFIFEMANNHQGDVAHGKRIIKEMAAITREFGIRGAMKLQLRDLDTFIHPKYRNKKDVKHIPRFLSTALTKKEFKVLVDEIKRSGLISVATPFDEASVALLEELGIEVAKVAGCSAHDWPLLERIAASRKPVIASVAGLTLKEVDRVVSFFEHRGVDFALEHCVAIYPTPASELHLHQIELMRQRYPKLVIGFSTHEEPSNTTAIALAYAKGARIFEKHVGVPTKDIKLNAYSADPAAVREWVSAYLAARAALGEGERTITESERSDLRSLVRGVFAARPIKKGATISKKDVFFAMPLVSEDQLRSGRFREGYKANRAYKKNDPIDRTVEPERPSKRDIVYSTIHEVKGMLNVARIPLNHEFSVEISHHHGLERLHETGCVIINCINREYAKKLIVQLPGQSHPMHYHKGKDETFQVLFGSMDVNVEGRDRKLHPGDVLWVPRGVWHSFRSDDGVIFEEISTTANDAAGDSFYIDKEIAAKPRNERKTFLMNWGRHQFDNEE